MNDRGDFRSFYVSMLDDPDFREMSGDDFKVFFALRLTLGAAGIGILRRLVLCDQLKITPAKLEKRLVSLEKAKPDNDRGWIVWDHRSDIVWIVNALKYEPSLSSKNENQRKYINGLVKPLSPHSKAVKGFWNQYPDWRLDAEPDVPDSPYIEGGPPSPADGVGMGSEGGQKHKRQATATSDKRQATITSDSDRAHSQNGATTETPRDRFVDRFYPWTAPKRRSEVEQQLAQLLEREGLEVSKGVVAKANSQAHLDKVLTAVLRGRAPRDPDKAIVFVIRKIQDPELDAKGRTSTEADSAQRKDEDRLLERWNDARRNAVEVWLHSHPTEAEDIERLVKPQADNEFSLRGLLMIEYTKAAGFPDFETWSESQAVPA